MHKYKDLGHNLRRHKKEILTKSETPIPVTLFYKINLLQFMSLIVVDKDYWLF